MRERAWRRAGLSELVARRLGGEALTPAELGRAAGADLLALGAAADDVRRVECGDEVRVYTAAPPAEGPLVRVIGAGEARRGTELLRGLALERLAAPRGARFCWDYAALGLEFAQVSLAFGVSDWAGPARRGGALPLAGDPKHLPSRRDELAGLVARAGRRAVFVDAGAPVVAPAPAPLPERRLP
jgi:2-iminoacetate synthase ThiH